MANNKFDFESINEERVHKNVNGEMVYCPICHCLLWKPVACKSCENSYCSPCMEEWISKNQDTCPLGCRYEQRKCPPLLMNILSKLAIECRYKTNGCSEVVAYEALEKHQNECIYQLVQWLGCEQKKLEKDLDQHQHQQDHVESQCAESEKTYVQEDISTHNGIKCLQSQSNSTKEEMEQKTYIQQNISEQGLKVVEEMLKTNFEQLTKVISENDRKYRTTMGNLEQRIQQLESQAQIGSWTSWAERAITIAGSTNGAKGSSLNEMNSPQDLFVDNENNVYVADTNNHRIIKWKQNASVGEIVAGDNGPGKNSNQLNCPAAVFVDKSENMYISDHRNNRVQRWSKGMIVGETVIGPCSQGSASNQINDFYCLFINKSRNIYIADCWNHRIMLWKANAIDGIVVAGGNGSGNALNQLYCPWGIYVDENDNIYIADAENHRIQKWCKGSAVGITVAGGNGQGSNLNQLNRPHSVTLDRNGNIYVADQWNHRIVQWITGHKAGRIIAGGNGQGCQPNQLFRPQGINFDARGNLYVADCYNHRVQRFTIHST
ncbi:unnamed protein product [Didymodactylos carnosus]|uniref:RING-type domain-containing protein n=1 Tax=Didymodactylos carnosus TaxID=1234261 RepID=A0A813Z0R3_9BILA|nr:unnamed protein product [Didymodactylos carnosus]CAF3675696.1 unnamed protein product [Didymodactylos carnosus]